MAVNFLQTAPTKASKSQVRVRTVSQAQKAIVSGLRGQKEIWEKDKGASLPANAKAAGKGYKGETKTSIWFKKKDDNNDYLLCIKCGTTKLGASEPVWKDRLNKKTGKTTRVNINNDYYWTVPENEMTASMDLLMKQVEDGDWDERILWAMPTLTQD